MDAPTAGLGRLAATSRRLVLRLVAVAENRLELLTVEVQQERLRLLHAFLLGLAIAALALLAGIAFTGAMAVLFWRFSPLAVLLALAAIYGAGAMALYRRLAAILADWGALSASLDQLRKDRADLERILS